MFSIILSDKRAMVADEREPCQALLALRSGLELSESLTSQQTIPHDNTLPDIQCTSTETFLESVAPDRE
jgi:hypothetical protein